MSQPLKIQEDADRDAFLELEVVHVEDANTQGRGDVLFSATARFGSYAAGHGRPRSVRPDAAQRVSVAASIRLCIRAGQAAGNPAVLLIDLNGGSLKDGESQLAGFQGRHWRVRKPVVKNASITASLVVYSMKAAMTA
jgi:hypothetical protein